MTTHTHDIVRYGVSYRIGFTRYKGYLETQTDPAEPASIEIDSIKALRCTNKWEDSTAAEWEYLTSEDALYAELVMESLIDLQARADDAADHRRERAADWEDEQ